MSHVRQQIREQIATAVTGLAVTGSNVFQSRVYPVEKANLPCLLVFTEGESVEIETAGISALQRRNTVVTVQAIASATADLDDTLDTICSQVETAIYGASTISNDTRLLNTDIELTAIGEKPVGTATMTYSMILSTFEGSPDTAL